MILELPVPAASITDVNRGPASGREAALLLINQGCVFFLCRLARDRRGWRGLLVEEHILCFFFIVLKKNYLLKREMVSCLVAVFFLLMIKTPSVQQRDV